MLFKLFLALSAVVVLCVDGRADDSSYRASRPNGMVDALREPLRHHLGSDAIELMDSYLEEADLRGYRTFQARVESYMRSLRGNAITIPEFKLAFGHDFRGLVASLYAYAYLRSQLNEPENLASDLQFFLRQPASKIDGLVYERRKDAMVIKRFIEVKSQSALFSKKQLFSFVESIQTHGLFLAGSGGKLVPFMPEQIYLETSSGKQLMLADLDSETLLSMFTLVARPTTPVDGFTVEAIPTTNATVEAMLASYAKNMAKVHGVSIRESQRKPPVPPKMVGSLSDALGKWFSAPGRGWPRIIRTDVEQAALARAIARNGGQAAVFIRFLNKVQRLTLIKRGLMPNTYSLVRHISRADIADDDVRFTAALVWASLDGNEEAKAAMARTLINQQPAWETELVSPSFKQLAADLKSDRLSCALSF